MTPPEKPQFFNVGNRPTVEIVSSRITRRQMVFRKWSAEHMLLKIRRALFMRGTNGLTVAAVTTGAEGQK
jgi:hypothetical protein